MTKDELTSKYQKLFQDALNNRDYGKIEQLKSQMETEARQVQQEEFANQSKKEVEGLKLQYSPVEEVVGPDGKKTIQLRKELQMAGPEAYVQSERQRLAQQQMLGKSDLAQQLSQQQAQQQGRLAQYGLKGGNRALLSRYSMQDALMAQQGLGRQYQQQAGELEKKGMELGRETQAANINTLGQGISGINQFELEKFKKMKEIEASKNMAQATRDASKSTK